MKNYDHDLALAAEKDADPETVEQADNIYAEAMESLEDEPQKQCRQPGCTRLAETAYMPGYEVCRKCLDMMSR